MRKIDLEYLWDRTKVCRNPHKGWYLHYYDNDVKGYGNRLAPDDFLMDFPGLNHIYLRLAWCHLEPEEGRYDWNVIDPLIERWREHGYTVAFRISCKETGSDQTFATPRWVMAAGAQGTFLPTEDGGQVWEPDYGDPIFLAKLSNFHQAFAARYDKPWVEYIDIGSYGDWGEGHTAASSLKDWPYETIKQHIDIYRQHYQTSTLVISDDIVGSRVVDDGSREAILQYLIENGITLRDDGISVKWFADCFGLSTLRSPEIFTPFWKTRPIVIELEHYEATLRHATWQDGQPLVAACEESHATFVGFHGYAREWLAQNEALAKELANRVGYWFFPKSLQLPDQIEAGTHTSVKMVWINKGLAPAYHRYHLSLCLRDETGQTVTIPVEADPLAWLPGEFIEETYTFLVPSNVPSESFSLGILLKSDDAPEAAIAFSLVEGVQDEDGISWLVNEPC